MASLVSILYAAVLFAVGQSINPRDRIKLQCGEDFLDLGCVFGANCYGEGDFIHEACLTMQCFKGNWLFKGTSQKCGQCKVEGDPHIYTFEKFLTPSAFGSGIASKYLLNKTGEYVITQPGFSPSALFGVEANFKHCDYLKKYKLNGMCIDKATYYEPGINVTITLPNAKQAAECVKPNLDPKCDIQVSVNGRSIGTLWVTGEVQEHFGGDGGPILIFKHTNIDGPHNLNCVAVVGTKGFSVSLCEEYYNYPYLYIWAWPTLKSTNHTEPASQLHGMCNSFTQQGDNADTFVKQDKTVVPTEECLKWTVTQGYAWEICDEFSQSWKLPI